MFNGFLNPLLSHFQAQPAVVLVASTERRPPVGYP
jgi:hypothetical protein